jgi:hypothetical protein
MRLLLRVDLRVVSDSVSKTLLGCIAFIHLFRQGRQNISEDLIPEVLTREKFYGYTRIMPEAVDLLENVRDRMTKITNHTAKESCLLQQDS